MNDKDSLLSIVNRLGIELDEIMKTPEQIAIEKYIQESNQIGVIKDIPLLTFEYGKENKKPQRKNKE